MEHWLSHALFGVLLIMPWQSWKGIRLLDVQIARDAGARIMFYRSAIFGQWVLASIALVAMWSVQADSIGDMLTVELSGDALGIVGLATLAVLSQCALVPPVHRRMQRSAAARRAIYPLRNILPRSAAEKLMWINVALTAGICEEILFRGFLILYATEILGLETAGAIAVSSAIFAVGHYYQGLPNMIRVGVVGALLAIVFVMTDSILLCIILHAALDLGALRMGDLVASDNMNES